MNGVFTKDQDKEADKEGFKYLLTAVSIVISTVAGQLQGRPLIGQARGQLRLTWRFYVESPQSGEISFPK